MKKVLTVVLLLIGFNSFAQPCADEDTVRANAVSLITATSVRVNGTTSHFAGTVLSIQLRYVRVGFTDTATASAAGTNALRNLTGLQSNTTYRYYYTSVCGSGTNRQLGTYTFTTATAGVVYTDERSTKFPYVAVDSGLKIPRMATLSLFRAAGSRGGDIAFRTTDSLPYYYNGSTWKYLAVDSAGILPTLNRKVDSVTVSGDSLFYWVNGTGYGYILPGAVNIYNTDDTLTSDRTVEGDSKNLTFDNLGSFLVNGNGEVLLHNESSGVFSATEAASGYAGIYASRLANTRMSSIKAYSDSILIQPDRGLLKIDTLNASSNESDSMMVWTASGGNAGKVGYRAIPTSSGGTVTSVAQSFTGGLISVGGSPITTSGTLALTVAGTSGGIPYFSSGSTWASSAALTANALLIGGGAGAAPSSTTTGTGVLTALGTNVGSAGAFVVNGGALGTPSSGTVDRKSVV